MAITLEEVQQLKDELEHDYHDRHEDQRKLRQWWHGNYWQDTAGAATSLADIFRDLKTRTNDVGPDVKVVVNVLQEICVKYQTYLSPLPMIRCYTDSPESIQRKQQATLKERVLYGLWSEGNMRKWVNSLGWYLPLMADGFLGIWPDFDRSIPVPCLRSPEHAYPVLGFDGALRAVIFSWKMKEAQVARDFPTYIRDKGNSNVTVEIIEYSDDVEWARWAVPSAGQPQKLSGVEHNFGFNLFDQVPFIYVPDEPWNHSAVEQIVGMVEAGNIIHSLLVQSVFESVFPMLVLEDPSKAPEQIPYGPGAVLGLNPGGKAYYAQAPGNALAAHAGFSERNEQLAKEAAGMGPTNFGISPASSIVTGAAVSELQGAGSGSTVEMVQANGVGAALVSWNEKALFMLQNMFRDDTIRLHGLEPRMFADINPRAFGLTFKGSKIVGSQRNEVVFAPFLNLHDKLVMSLQSQGAGLTSKEYGRNQIGIPDSEAMDEEIVGETIQDAVIGAVVQNLTAEPTAEAAVSAEDQAFAFLQGATPTPAPAGAPAPTPLPGPPAGAPSPGGGPAIGPIAAGAPGQALSPAIVLPPGSPPPALAPTPGGAPAAAAPSPGGGTTITVDDAVADFQALDGINGQVFLVGEIVQRGQADGNIEVDVTDGSDRGTITSGLPQRYAGRLTFHVVSGDPNEPFVEVTPGQPAREGGPQPAGAAA